MGLVKVMKQIHPRTISRFPTPQTGLEGKEGYFPDLGRSWRLYSRKSRPLKSDLNIQKGCFFANLIVGNTLELEMPFGKDLYI